GPLLGVNGVVIIGHGRSDALAVENAVRVAIDAVSNKVVEAISAEIAAAQAHLDAEA
ncbi:MAG: phosphate acyltransferase, partial [Chloroflexi bacterium]|nr:phosphate acyltransferase [Chloroflexota bacterium]